MCKICYLYLLIWFLYLFIVKLWYNFKLHPFTTAPNLSGLLSICARFSKPCMLYVISAPVQHQATFVLHTVTQLLSIDGHDETHWRCDCVDNIEPITSPAAGAAVPALAPVRGRGPDHLRQRQRGGSQLSCLQPGQQAHGWTDAKNGRLHHRSEIWRVRRSVVRYCWRRHNWIRPPEGAYLRVWVEVLIWVTRGPQI